MRSSLHRSSETAMICINGLAPTLDTYERALIKTEYVVAADGGLNWMHSIGKSPDVVVGDLDSANQTILQNTNHIHIPDQYSTDMEKALEHVIAQGFQAVILLGLDAGRIDHCLANFFLMLSYAQKVHIEVWGDGWRGFFAKPKESLTPPVGTTVSLIPFSDIAGLTLQGFQYNLDNHQMRLGEVGVSNVTIEDHVSIEFDQGHLLSIVYA